MPLRLGPEGSPAGCIAERGPIDPSLDKPEGICYFPHSNGEVPEWSKGADCKSVGAAFEGSNPSLPIKPSIAEKVFYCLQHRGTRGRS